MSRRLQGLHEITRVHERISQKGPREAMPPPRLTRAMPQRHRAMAAQSAPGRGSASRDEIAVRALPAQNRQAGTLTVYAAHPKISIQTRGEEPRRTRHEQSRRGLCLIGEPHDIGGRTRLRRIAEGRHSRRKTRQDRGVVDPCVRQSTDAQAKPSDDSESALAADEQSAQVRTCRAGWCTPHIHRAHGSCHNKRLDHLVAAAVSGGCLPR